MWEGTSEKNIITIQRFQDKVVRCIANAPWYVLTSDLHRDLGVNTVRKGNTDLKEGSHLT